MAEEGLISSRTKSPYEGKSLVDNLRELGIPDHVIAEHLRQAHEHADAIKKSLGEPLHEKKEEPKEGALEKGAKAIKSGMSESAKQLAELDKQ